MQRVSDLIEAVAQRANVNLAEHDFDCAPILRDAAPGSEVLDAPAYYGLSGHEGASFEFSGSSLSGSCFLGRVKAENSVILRSDVRGDELKSVGADFGPPGRSFPLSEDETIRIKYAFLVNTLVHNNSHDPASPEEFFILRSAAMHYANIHGAPVAGCFLGPFATADLTTMRACRLGAYSYVQAGELSHRQIKPGQVFIHKDGAYTFHYAHDLELLDRYVALEEQERPDGATETTARYERAPSGEAQPQGVLMDLARSYGPDLKGRFESFPTPPVAAAPGASVSPYALLKGDVEIGENVLVAQRACVENSRLGPGANAQENCLIRNSTLAGLNITAHGAAIVNADLGRRVFVTFNSFLMGRPEARLKLGHGCIVVPHTIIDPEEPIEIPDNTLVFGLIRKRSDLAECSLPIEKLAEVRGETSLGRMRFTGRGERLVADLDARIEHILEENGALYDGASNAGHAQRGQDIAFNVLQPYPRGERQGLYPDMLIRS